MNTQLHSRFLQTSLLSFLLGATAPVSAETASPLDVTQHPDSPEYAPVYSGKLIPLDAQLSWTARFNGDETFNADEVLPQSIVTPLETSTMSIANDSTAMADAGVDGTGVVKGIRPEQGKVKIAHGPIDKFGMPAMTMMFKVDDPSLLDGLEKDQQIGFDIDNTSGGFVLTRIASMTEPEGNTVGKSNKKMDARGEIKTVRASQGKVKIKHGPIDKLGMPAMTMMFKVKDPAMLDALEKGSTVDFDVDNSSGGFVITDIVVVDE